MWLTMQHICEWAHTSPSERNYREGESILSVGHLLKCGKLLNSENDPNVKVVAFCMQTSQMRSDPHKINGEISKSGIIISMDCSCKAGLGDTCKHITATLLNCHRVSFNDLETISCTDQKCCWKEEHKKKLDEYTPRPFAEHACYKLKYSDNKYLVSSDTALIQEQIIFKFLPLSAFAKHRLGRHKAIAGYHPEEVRVSSNARKAMQIISAHQSNSIMRRIQELNCGPLKPCCAVRYANLHGDNQSICENTMLNCDSWKSERQMRITGSTCYSLYTYTKSRKQDWAKKCANHFNPVNFTSEYTQHGLVTESKARDDFAALFGKDVVQTGLVVSKENP